ncbi:LuxR family transcriptional regulator [Acrocarpospora phusangensis]|uniref:LuxR family transcriptional regulator n=1 Tax=Acrocarpospora phusangensis TaxID=1070424 RepID=A0A919QE82_9ACTN|nr:LuxR family transcriptional regulator [Acrocarpospora phusangensis]GIH25843.1 LuxR family transcriptional regulator [Acrocarpospora phusangensis]
MAVRFCPVLVGRDREMADLSAALADARAGTAGTRILTGVAGVGKSRLVAELAAEAKAAGMATLTGRATQAARRGAFRPVAEVLMAALRTTNPDDLAHLRPFRSALGRLVPDWADEGPAPEVSLVVLAEGVLRLLAAVAGERGALLVFEDLHWSDPETLEVLEYLADNLRSERVLCVATMRPDPDSEAYALARRLTARRSAGEVEVAALPPSAVRRMARLCLGIEETSPGTALPEALEPLVLARAEGLPLLVEDLLATARDSGVLRREGGAWGLADEAARVIPRDFADTVRRRVTLLGDPAGSLLQAGAALGTAFDWRIAAEASGLPAPAALAELRRAVEVGLLRVNEDEDGPSFGFHHALTRDAVWSTLLPHERLRLSAAALRAVEAHHPDLPGQWCDLAASLSERAGRSGHAASLLLQSGRRALARGALSTTEQVLERARRLAADSGDLPLRTAVGEALTEVLSLAGMTDRAFAAGDAVLAELARLPESAEARLRVHLCLARTAIGATRWSDAGRHLGHARELAEGPGTALAARIDVVAAQVAMGEERLDDATALAHSARTAAAPEVACEALIILGRRERLGDLAAAGRSFTEAYELARRHALPYWSIQALHELGTVETLSTGRVDRLRQAYEQAVGAGALATAAILDLQLAGAHHVRFEPALGLEAATRAADGARRFRLGHALPIALIQKAACHALTGHRAEMEETLRQAESIAPGDAAVGALAWGHGRALLALLQEDRDAAVRALDTAMAFIRRTPGGPPGIFRGLWALVKVLEDPREAYAREVRESGVTTLPMNAGPLGYADAVLLGHAGDTAGAESAFDAADTIMASWEGHDGLRNLAWRLVAEAALRDGWGEPAMWLRQAATYFAGTPHHAITSACQALLRSAGQPVPRLARGQVPAELRARGVTGRETDVLALLGLRLSNKEIADRLVLSPRTIEKHVERLMSKTGLDDRLALAGLAARLRLADRPLDT